MAFMKRLAAGFAISGLIAIAGYSVLVAAVAVSKGKGHGPVFWAGIGVVLLVVVGALWGAKRLYVRQTHLS
jgi:hypothetical protein